MDVLNRHKRSFTEMSHTATLSPSPIAFGDPSSNSFSTSRFSAGPSNEQILGYFDRRRTSHPHNHSLQQDSAEMADRTYSQSRPRLHTATSIIDLTDEPDDTPAPSQPRNRNRASRPPQLGRSDAVSVANLGDFIDLTEDNGPDIEIIAARQIATPRGRAPRARGERQFSPSLFMPAVPVPPPRHINQVFGRDPPAAQVIARPGPVSYADRIQQQAHNFFNEVAEFAGGIRMFVNAEDVRAQLHLAALQHEMRPQQMPNGMDYRNPAFRKPEHVAPAPAREDFTRSPTEKDVIICPSCEQELIHKKDDEEPVVRKGGRAPTKKDREEHPFWVVKECGHVYCNNCYQNRTSNKHPGVSFPEKPESSSSKRSSARSVMCAVDDCTADLRAKDKWVGVFL